MPRPILRLCARLAPKLALRLRRRAPSERIADVIVDEANARQRYGVATEQLAVGTQTLPLATLAETRVIAQPLAIVAADGTLLWPFCPQLQRKPFRHAVIWREKPLSPPRRIPGRTLCAGVDGFSYYHWLTGTLPKLLLASRAQLGLAGFDHILVNPRHRGQDNFQIQTLNTLGVGQKPLLWIDRTTNYIFEQLAVTPEPCLDHQTQLESWALRLLRDAFLPRALSGDIPRGPERIFISRAAARRRRLVDEDDLAARLTKLGYERVVLEELPFLTQARWFAEAKAVVGLHGAGLANLVFSQPGIKVVEIMPKVWPNPCFSNLSGMIGASYRAVHAAAAEGARQGFAADARADIDTIVAVCR